MPEDSPPDEQYVVVARRYRPQTFEDLIGQQHVAQALCNAISTNRVGHAYLFTGARGVGKTSAARILAKALNCETGPTTTPCNRCNACESVSSGDDVDVLEIDGASNRGIDEIRQLRSNVNIRPSCSKHKIYIIDEVHMLTIPAFNALLKTLEEPPEHVKFIFCTTDPEKIPITVLSRCQRFDFIGIQPDAITTRLRQIVDAEGIGADEEALQILARRANGSMRDSQSLLEQLLAFGGSHLSVDAVNMLLGTAGGDRLDKLVAGMHSRDASAALAELDKAIGEGVDVGQLMQQLLGHFRDMMAVAVGCQAELMLHSTAAEYERLVVAGKEFGLETILAVMQILDQALLRMRQSTHSRVLAEMALVRICHLENLDDLSALIAQVDSTAGSSGGGVQGRPSPIAKKKTEPVTAAENVPINSPSATVSTNAPPATVSTNSPPATVTAAEPSSAPKPPVAGEVSPTQASRSQTPLTDRNAVKIWGAALEEVGGMASTYARKFHRVAISAPNQLVVSFSAEYNFNRSQCERPENRAQLEKTLSGLVGSPVSLTFETVESPRTQTKRKPPVSSAITSRKWAQKAAAYPLVAEAMELFDAEIVAVEPPQEAAAKPR